MATSAPGSFEFVRAAGYTLLELLVTLAIIGIAVGMLSLSVRGDESRKLREEADRLAALFRIAQSEARVSGRAVVWQADLGGYRFRALVADAAQPLPRELLVERKWPLPVQSVQTRELLFAREPLREPAVVAITTEHHGIRLALDALGSASTTECEGNECAASR